MRTIVGRPTAIAGSPSVSATFASVSRRLVLVAIVALAVASPAAAFSQEDDTQTMDDGVSIALTRYTPDGRPPVGGWPGVMVLHGLGQGRRGVESVSAAFATAGYSVLAYDARGHA